MKTRKATRPGKVVVDLKWIDSVTATRLKLKWMGKIFQCFLLIIFIGCGGPVPTESDDSGTNQDPPSSGCPSSVTLSWDPNPETDIVGYNVYIGSNTRNYINSIPVGNVTTYQVLDLKCSTYYFAVTALNAFAESDYSNEVSVNMSTLKKASN